MLKKDLSAPLYYFCSTIANLIASSIGLFIFTNAPEYDYRGLGYFFFVIPPIIIINLVLLAINVLKKRSYNFTMLKDQKLLAIQVFQLLAFMLPWHGQGIFLIISWTSILMYFIAAAIV